MLLGQPLLARAKRACCSSPRRQHGFAKMKRTLSCPRARARVKYYGRIGTVSENTRTCPKHHIIRCSLLWQPRHAISDHIGILIAHSQAYPRQEVRKNPNSTLPESRSVSRPRHDIGGHLCLGQEEYHDRCLFAPCTRRYGRNVRPEGKEEKG